MTLNASTFNIGVMLKPLLSWLTAIALAAMPVAAWAAAPCPMAASGQMTEMDHAAGSPMQKNCDHKPVKSCTEICAAMAGVAVDLPATLIVAMPAPTGTLVTALPSAILVARQPAGLDRPPRTIV